MKFMETVDHTASITKSMETTSNILDVVNEVETIILIDGTKLNKTINLFQSNLSLVANWL